MFVRLGDSITQQMLISVHLTQVCLPHRLFRKLVYVPVSYVDILNSAQTIESVLHISILFEFYFS
jgi:hypothetical protein